jgi:hypothetical protein
MVAIVWFIATSHHSTMEWKDLPHHWMFVLMVIDVFQGEANYQGLIDILGKQQCRNTLVLTISRDA